MKEPENNKQILITGGTRGIGKAVAINLAKRYVCNFYLVYLQKSDEAESTAKEIESLGSHCTLIQANLQYQEEAEKVFEIVEKQTTHIDYIVHCAALTAFRSAMLLKRSHLEMTMNINTSSLLTLSQKFQTLMTNGSIVAISSGGSSKVLPHYTAMGVTKSALEALVRYLAVELAEKGIRINCISPGLIETESIKNFPDYNKLKELSISKTPIKRLGTVDEVADIIAFLLSDESKLITGQNITADGGFSLI